MERTFERGLARRDRDVLRDGAETGAAVRDGEVVVDGLRHADRRDRVAQLPADLGHLVGRVHRVAAAVIEEIADVVGLEDLDEPLVLRAVLVDAPELVARRPEGAARRIPEPCDRAGALGARVDHVLGQRADDAIAPGVNLADTVPVFPRRLDHAASRGIDDRGHAARLRIKRVPLHRFLPVEFVRRPKRASITSRLRLTKNGAAATVPFFQIRPGRRVCTGPFSGPP